MPSLFDPIRLGAIEAPNRIFLAPLTRGRATRDHVPTPLMAQYYAQRATGGLLFTEATGISLQGLGWPYAPGIWNEQQTQAWKVVTDAVHAVGGRIVCQLWHMGRVVHPSLPGRSQPVSSSATTAPGHAHTYDGPQPNVLARPLRVDELPALMEDYRRAARNAMAAGFDGVQLHAANGYLIDQFLRDNSNFRDDAYGGPAEHRIRLLREVATALVETVGKERVGVRLSPNGEVQGVNDSHPELLFPLAAAMLSEVGVSYLELREPGTAGSRGTADHPPIAPLIQKAFRGPMVLNSDYTFEKAEAALIAGAADAISFGRPFLANPDLPNRFANFLPLNPPRPELFYTQGPEGYTDYPAAAR